MGGRREGREGGRELGGRDGNGVREGGEGREGWKWCKGRGRGD